MIGLRMGIRTGFGQKHHLRMQEERHMGIGITLDYSSISGILLLFGLGIALAVLGYLVRGVWGAIIALGIGALLFLYSQGLLPF